MNDVDFCPACGNTEIFKETEKVLFLYGYGIGCTNPLCRNYGRLIIKYGLTEESAKKKAIKSWMRS